MKKGKALLTAIALSMFVSASAFAGNAKDFFQNTSMTVSTNYNPNGLPTNTDDVRLTSSATALRITAGSVTAESLTVQNGLSYTIANATSTSTNSTLTLGNPSGFTNTFSGVGNDLIALSANSNLTIQGPNASTGSGTLRLVLASNGNFNVASGSSLTITSVISGAFSISKTGGGTATFGAANTYSGGTTIDAGTLIANADGALGTGNVSLTGGNVTLTLQNGAVNDYIADSATLSYINTDVINLNFTGTDTVAGLIVDGVAQAPGVYGASATNPDGAFTGTGTITVVPEPATLAMVGLGAGLLAGVRRFRRKLG